MRIVLGTSVMILVCFLLGCGNPDQPKVETGIIQTVQATNAALVSQMKLEQFLTHLKGQIGPDMEIEVEPYTKISTGVRIRIRGANLEFDTQASGTGGGPNYNAAVWQDLMQIQQRWERADDLSKADARKWWFEVKDAITKVKVPTSRPVGVAE